MSKKTVHISVRLDRDSYFKIANGPNCLTSLLDRDQSWIINRAVHIGLLALEAEMPTTTDTDKYRAALFYQSARLRELELKADTEGTSQ